ncbi:hypothetical protein BE20_21105 [Sorangium cellulosum]|nr:hypothetical protein BE20_21105 [Sorangium cellulosum]
MTPNEARRTVPSGPAERGLDPFAGLDFSSSPGGTPAGRVSQGAGQQITFSGGSGEASVSDPLAQRSPPRRGGAGRALVVFGVLVLAAGAAYAGYRQFLKPTTLPPVSSSAAPPPVVSAPSSSASAAAVPARADAQPEPPGLQWPPLVAQAQESIAAGDLKAALRLLRDAQEKGNHPVPRTLIEHVQVALKDASGKAPCQLTGLARPRTHDLVREGGRAIGASRPSISLGPRGAVITWTDSHEGTEHAYTAALDSAMRPSSPALDVTPEGRAIGRPELTTAGDRLVLTYWDGKGPEAGVYVRWLDASGRIDGPAMMVARFPRGGNSWPSLTRAPEGFVIAWSDDGDNASSEDLFMRRLSPNLDPVGEIIRLTDVTPTGPSKPRVRLPSIAVTSDVMHLAFRFDRDPMRVIQYMRLPLASADKGLPPAAPGKRADRALGELSLVNSDRARSDSPSLACGAAGCFVVWHGEAPIGGASAAYIDPAKGQPLWRKRFSKTGARPSVAIAPSGQAQLVWFEQGRMLTASINRDGIGAPTKFARVSGDQPAPSISPGAKPGEWYVAWLDYEAGHLEPYAARIQCR